MKRVFLLMVMLYGCASSPAYRPEEGNPANKITFDLSVLDEQDLYGPPAGKRSLAYEFCIPDTSTHRAEVAAIDPGVRFMCRSAGRMGCGRDDCLFIGETDQYGYRIVLARLTALSYIRHIDQSHFE